MYDKAEHKAEASGGGKILSHKTENKDNSLWWVGGFMIALILLAAILSII